MQALLANLAATACAHYVRQYFYNQPPGSRESTPFLLCSGCGQFNGWAIEDGKHTSQERSKYDGIMAGVQMFSHVDDAVFRELNLLLVST